MFGCAQPPDETQEIVGSLLQAGFPADDIMVVDGKVYVGRDAEVSLAASREMLAADDSTEEQYRTTNLVSPSLWKICIEGSTFTGVFSTALDSAIQNYNELPLAFRMARTPSTGCSFTINAVIDPNMNGGVAGFPANGYPFGQITIGGQLRQFSVDVIEHVITHELGHTIGFRHSDYYNRSISCGSGGNEGDAGIGAIHIPGTPTTATVGGSLMNSCFRTSETGEFSSSDVTALRTLYAVQEEYLVGDWDGDGRSNLAVRRGSCVHMDHNFDGAPDFTQCYGDSTQDVYMVGDWDGDGRSNLAVRRGSCVLMDYNFDGAADFTQCYGDSTQDVYMVGDWNGDRRSNLAVRRGGCVLMDYNFDGAADFTQCY
ncbi:MAG TPA: zinc-dependent metalloprotease [Archangium sp.]|nr:zinc-dependent metalloprotease [Archangium sp.]